METLPEKDHITMRDAVHRFVNSKVKNILSLILELYLLKMMYLEIEIINSEKNSNEPTKKTSRELKGSLIVCKINTQCLKIPNEK